MLGRNSVLHLGEEEKLTQAEIKYSCLYDKSCKKHKNKMFMENAWAEVGREIGFE